MRACSRFLAIIFSAIFLFSLFFDLEDIDATLISSKTLLKSFQDNLYILHDTTENQLVINIHLLQFMWLIYTCKLGNVYKCYG